MAIVTYSEYTSNIDYNGAVDDWDTLTGSPTVKYNGYDVYRCIYHGTDLIHKTNVYAFQDAIIHAEVNHDGWQDQVGWTHCPDLYACFHLAGWDGFTGWADLEVSITGAKANNTSLAALEIDGINRVSSVDASGYVDIRTAVPFPIGVNLYNYAYAGGKLQLQFTLGLNGTLYADTPDGRITQHFEGYRYNINSQTHTDNWYGTNNGCWTPILSLSSNANGTYYFQQY